MRKEENDHSMNLSSKRYLSMASGGTRAFCYLGALDAMEDHFEATTGMAFDEWRAGLKGVAGTSAGTLCALAVLLGIPKERRKKLRLHPRHIMSFPDVTLLLTRFGLEDGSAFRECIKEVLTQGGLSPESTLGDVKRLLQKEFVCMCTDLKTGEELPLSSTHTPDVLVCDAVYASCSIPFVFAPTVIGDHLATDGCLSCTLPNVFEVSDTLFFDIDAPRSTSSINTWPEFLGGIVRANLRLQDARLRDLAERGTVVRMKLFPPFSMVGMDFDMDDAALDKLCQEGYASVMEVLYDNRLSSALSECVTNVVHAFNALRLDAQDAAPPHEDIRGGA